MLGASRSYGGIAPNYFPWNTLLLGLALCWCIMFIPFLVTDLYYAYRDTSCVQLDVGSIDVTLSAWLQVDGWIILAFLLAFVTIGILALCFPGMMCLYGVWEAMHVIFILWRLTWLIVGSIIFWGNYNKTGLCQTNVSRYIWAMLIIGFIWLFVELLLAFAYVRPVPQPVPVPVAATPTGPIVAPTNLTNTTSSAFLYPRRY